MQQNNQLNGTMAAEIQEYVEWAKTGLPGTTFDAAKMLEYANSSAESKVIVQNTIAAGLKLARATATATPKQGPPSPVHPEQEPQGARARRRQRREVVGVTSISEAKELSEVDEARHAIDALSQAIDVDMELRPGERDMYIAQAVSGPADVDEYRDAIRKVDEAIAQRVIRAKAADAAKAAGVVGGKAVAALRGVVAAGTPAAKLAAKTVAEVERKIVADATAAIDARRAREVREANRAENARVEAEAAAAAALDKQHVEAKAAELARRQIARAERRAARADRVVEVERQKSLASGKRKAGRAGNNADDKVKRIKCYRCGERGHVQADCQYGEDEVSDSSGSTSGGSSSSDESSSGEESSASAGFQQSKRKQAKPHVQSDAHDVALKYGNFSAPLKATNWDLDAKVGVTMWAVGTAAAWASTVAEAVAPRLQSFAQVVSEAVPRFRILGVEVITGPIAQATPVDARTLQQMISRNSDTRARGGIEAMTNNVMRAVSVAPLARLVDLTNTTPALATPTAGQLLAGKLAPTIGVDAAVAAGDGLDDKLVLDTAVAEATAEAAAHEPIGGVVRMKHARRLRWLIRFVRWAGFAVAMSGLARKLLPPQVDYEFEFVHPDVATTDDVRPSNQKARDAFFNDGQLAQYKVTRTPAVVSGFYRLSRWVGNRNENARVASALRGINSLIRRTQIVTHETISLELMATCLNPRICANAATGGEVERIYTAVGMAAGTDDRINYDRHRAAADQVPASTARAAMALLVSRGEIARFSF